MSGLTIYAQRLSEALVKKGHSVTVLSSQFDSELPKNETIGGVKVVRVPVKLKISKGGLMPEFGKIASRLIKEHDVVHLHTPQFDGARVALRAKIQRKPIIITHHCDLRMPKGFVSWLANQSVLFSNNLAAVCSDQIITYTQDYADNSRFVRRYLKKQRVINPPVVLPKATLKEIKSFKKNHLLILIYYSIFSILITRCTKFSIFSKIWVCHQIAEQLTRTTSHHKLIINSYPRCNSSPINCTMPSSCNRTITKTWTNAPI